MNKIIIDFPERLQSNAFGIWLEREGFAAFQKYYASAMPTERQPESMEIEYDDAEGISKHYATIE